MKTISQAENDKDVSCRGKLLFACLAVHISQTLTDHISVVTELIADRLETQDSSYVDDVVTNTNGKPFAKHPGMYSNGSYRASNHEDQSQVKYQSKPVHLATRPIQLASPGTDSV